MACHGKMQMKWYIWKKEIWYLATNSIILLSTISASQECWLDRNYTWSHKSEDSCTKRDYPFVITHYVIAAGSALGQAFPPYIIYTRGSVGRRTLPTRHYCYNHNIWLNAALFVLDCLRISSWSTWSAAKYPSRQTIPADKLITSENI